MMQVTFLHIIYLKNTIFTRNKEMEFIVMITLNILQTTHG